MSTGRTVVLELTRMEAAHLAGLVTQFADLLVDAESTSGDPAIARLVPDAYPDDAEAAQEFRDVTEGDLLDRRRQDAAHVLASLHDPATIPDDAEPDDEILMELVELRLEPDALQAWLRCLAAIRLVLATRLDIRTEEDHDVEDPRFGIYEWLGYRLDGLVQAASDETDRSRDREDVRGASRGFVPREMPLLLLGPARPVRAEGLLRPAPRPGASVTARATPATRAHRPVAPSRP